jgi:hypothetical protein
LERYSCKNPHYYKEERVSKAKVSKDYIIVLCCVNMYGNTEMKFVVVSKEYHCKQPGGTLLQPVKSLNA